MWALVAAALVWAAFFAIGWHYLVAPFPPLARRIPATRRRRSTPPQPDPTMTPRIRPHLLTLLALVMAATCGGSSLAAAQDTAAVRGLTTRTKVDQDSIAKISTSARVDRIAARAKARQDSITAAMARVVTPPPAPPPVPAPSVLTARIEIRPSTGSFLVGTPVQFTATPKAVDGSTLPAAITWFASPSSVATITGAGVLTPIAAGTVTVTARADTASKSVALAITAPVVVDTAPPTPPAPGPSPSPTPLPTAGFDGPAELPRATVDVTIPTGYTVVNVPAQAAALQAALDAAGCRTELRGAPGFSYAPLTLRQKPCTERYHTIIRTANGLPDVAPGTRMTPGLSAQRNQTKIVSTGGNVSAVTAGPGVRGYYFEDVNLRVTAGPLNALVYLGTSQTTLAQVPGDFVFSHVYAGGTPTVDLKRCFYLNSFSTAIVGSWIDECHSNAGDSQCILMLNGPGPYGIVNNYCEAGHEVIMLGGGDPSIQGLIPSDITLIGNHITRPASWKGVWQVKNLIECKNARRLLVEGNVVENNWEDAQVGYGFLCKSVNQDGTAPWSQSRDVTVRYNLFRNVGAGFNLCAACQGTVVPATAMSLHDNVTIGVNVGQFLGEAREWQFLGALTNISILHNTTINAAGVATAISFDGQPPKITTLAFQSNVYDNGQYGVHGGSGGGVWTTWVDSATSKWTNNLAYPPGTAAAAGFDARGVYSSSVLGHDGRPIGADALKVYALTASAVVSDPQRPQLRRTATAQQSGYRATSPAQRAYNTKH